MSFDRLIDGIVKMQNPTVAGLDPKLDFIPDYIKENAYMEHTARRSKVQQQLSLSSTRDSLMNCMISCLP